MPGGVGWARWGRGEGIGYQGVGGPVLDPVLELEFELEFEFPDPADRLDNDNNNLCFSKTSRRTSASVLMGHE